MHVAQFRCVCPCVFVCSCLEKVSHISMVNIQQPRTLQEEINAYGALTFQSKGPAYLFFRILEMISNIKYTAVPRGGMTTKEFFTLIFSDHNTTPLPPPSIPHSSFFSLPLHPLAKTIINYPYPAALSHPSSFWRWGFHAAWLLSNPLSVHHLSFFLSAHGLRLTASEQINNNYGIAAAGVGHVTEQTIIWICSQVHIMAHIKHKALMSQVDSFSIWSI